jgi:ABC-type multidrug transport system fused ATPase/permease subunit
VAKRRKSTSDEDIRKGKISSFIGIYSYLRPYWLQYSIGWVFLVFSSAIGLLFPYLLGKLLGTTGEGMSSSQSLKLLSLDNINSVALALFLIFGLQAIFSFVRVITFTNVTENTLRDIRNQAFERLILMPMDFFNRNKVGELTSRLSNDISQIQETMRTTVAEFFRQIVIVLGGTLFLFFISWKLALIMFGTVPIMAIVAVVFGRFIRKLSKQAQDYTATSNSIVEEALSGIANVKSFTQEWLTIKKYNKSSDQIRELNVKSGLWRGLFVSFIIFCLFGAIVFIIWRGLLMTQGSSPELSSEGFYQFVLFTIMMGASVGSLPELYASIQKAAGATENLVALLQEKTERMESKGIKKPVITGEINFNNVHFCYPQRSDIEVLKGISFEVKANQTLALVGSSGSGKTTISNLILNYYPNYSGKISISDVSLQEIDLEYLRQNMAIVPQEVMLFAGSIRENLLFAKPTATEDMIIEAAKNANAWEFIQGFPNGLETQVGDRGIQLSGGQKQRIAIARAILKDPSILILDEATSSLDSESERLVQDALNNLMKGRTSIVIAHRLSTIKLADKILVLKEGKIVEQGTHDSLIGENGFYAHLVDLQRMNSGANDLI